MKNKQITYFLITVVVIIWGGIFYRIFSSFFSSDEGLVRVAATPVIETPDNIFDAGSYTLKASYRDPFLGNTTIDKTESSRQIRIKPPEKKVQPVAAVDWSFVKYFGLIKNSGNNTKIGLISINNREHMIREGEVISDLKCMKSYNDSIIISYQGRVACIKR